MPLNKALEQLKEDYCDYITFIKAKESAAAKSRMAANAWALNDNTESDAAEAKSEKFAKLSSLLKYVLNGCGGDSEKQKCSYKIKDLELLKISLDRLKRDALKLPDFKYIPEEDEDKISFQSQSIKPLLEYTQLQPLMPPSQPLLPLPLPIPLLAPPVNSNLSSPRPLMLPPALQNINYQSQQKNSNALMSHTSSMSPYITQTSQITHQQSIKQMPQAQCLIPQEQLRPLMPRFDLNNYSCLPIQTNASPRSLLGEPPNMPSLMSFQANQSANSNKNNNNNKNGDLFIAIAIFLYARTHIL